MGAQSTVAALTETRGGTAPTGHRLYVGIDAGRRHHVVAAIPTERMENGSWERAGIHRTPTTSRGFRELTDWFRSLGSAGGQIAGGCEPTGGWYAQTVAAWLERHGYEISWLQNFAIHERRQLLIGKQTKTDALDARLIARLLYERDAFGLRKGFLHHPPRSTDALRMLVRNRHQLVEQRTRYRLQLTAIVDRSRRRGRDVTGDPSGKRELGEELPETGFILADVRIDLAVGALEVGMAHQRRAPVTRTSDIEHIQVILLDDPVQVNVDEILARCGAPVPDHERFHMR